MYICLHKQCGIRFGLSDICTLLWSVTTYLLNIYYTMPRSRQHDCQLVLLSLLPRDWSSENNRLFYGVQWSSLHNISSDTLACKMCLAFLIRCWIMGADKWSGKLQAEDCSLALARRRTNIGDVGPASCQRHHKVFSPLGSRQVNTEEEHTEAKPDLSSNFSLRAALYLHVLLIFVGFRRNPWPF